MPVQFHHAELPNGLTVVGEIDHAAHTASCGFFVRTGARDERPDVMGVSHFLEHMMFKGTDRRTAEDVNREFDEIGAQYNAYTSSEITCFYGSVLPERFDAAADLLSDILRPALRSEDFDTEKGVILEEIAMYADSPFFSLYETAMERYYGSHPLGHRVLGTPDTVGALQRDAMADYFTHRYSADNTVVAVAGALDFDHAVNKIGDACGSWERTGVARDLGDPAPNADDFGLRDEKCTRGYCLIVAPAPAMADDRRYAAMMLAKILGDPDNSRLHWSLIETGIAEEAQAAYDPRDGCGDYFVFASGDPDRLPQIRRTVETEIAGLRDSLTQDDLERLRNRVATAVTLAGERPSGRMQRLGRLYTYLGDYLSLEEELERIHSVTLAELKDVAAAFPFEPRTTGVLLPAG